MSANADVNRAGFFIASAYRRCQAIEKNFFAGAHAPAKRHAKSTREQMQFQEVNGDVPIK